VEYNSGSNRASNFEIGRAQSARPIWNYEHNNFITTWIVRHEVQLLINRNYNKIREEYDSGLNYLTGLYIQLLSYIPEKKSHSSATSASLMTRTVQLLRHDAYNCPITSAWCVQLSNYGWNQACWWPIRFENFDIAMIMIIIIVILIMFNMSIGQISIWIWSNAPYNSRGNQINIAQITILQVWFTIQIKCWFFRWEGKTIVPREKPLMAQ